MANWKYRVKIKHLFTEREDIDSIQESMNKVADILIKNPCFDKFLGIKNFRNISKGDDVITPRDYANKLIEKLYDYADDRLIWIE